MAAADVGSLCFAHQRGVFMYQLLTIVGNLGADPELRVRR